MEKKIVFLAACLVVMLLCSAPQVIFASDHQEDYDSELVVDFDAGEPEFDEEDGFDGDDDFELDEEDEENGNDEEEGSDEEY